MKKLLYVTSVFLIVFAFLPVCVSAQPKVPITYPGDTDQTISRRAQWIEAAKTEKILVWWGDLRPQYAIKIIADFNKIYPFIRVDYARQASEESATKLEAEFAAGRGSQDIMQGGGRVNVPRWRKKGMIQNITHLIPGVERIPKNMITKAGDAVMAGNNCIVPMYNTRLVSAREAPKTWEDLLDPKWKGHLGMTADMKLWAIFALDETSGWGMQKTEQYLAKLREQKPIWASGHTAGHTLMIAGEFKIMVEDYLYHALNSQKRKAPVDWVRASPVAITGQAVTFMTKAPHPNCAKLFLEWLFSSQGLKSYESVTQQGAVFPGAGTTQADLLEGLTLIPRTEEIENKIIELELFERFADILGIKPSY